MVALEPRTGHWALEKVVSDLVPLKRKNNKSVFQDSVVFSSMQQSKPKIANINESFKPFPNGRSWNKI